MEDPEPDIADLSVWLGKPPETTAGFSSNAVDRKRAVVEIQDSSDYATRNSESNTGSEMEQNEKQRSMPAQELDDDETISIPRESDIRNKSSVASHSFYIDVPEFEPGVLEEYDYLPGHFTAKRILQQFRGDRYLVKLGSGEKDLVSAYRYD